MKKRRPWRNRTRAFWLSIESVVVTLVTVAPFAMLHILDRFHWLRASTVSVLGILAVMGLVVGITATLFSRQFNRMVSGLTRGLKAVADGDFSQYLEPEEGGPLQPAYEDFNKMSKELQSIQTLRSDFINHFSHEFKTPLTAIEGYAMLLQDTGLTQAERDEYLDKILYNTHRLSTLVGNILMLSKLENQSLSDQRSTFRLDEQLRQAVVMLEPQWEEKSLSFRAELDAVSVTACEPLLLQVWTNLIGNAIKFSEPRQELFLRLLDQTECAVVSVTDHGCGMTPEVQARIFEKFYQGDSSRKAMGNGLGLPLVKRIVELSDGVIEVDSAPGQGSTFRVILPKK